MASFFTHEDNTRILNGWDIAMNAPQPINPTDDSAYWPATEFASLQINTMNDRYGTNPDFGLSHIIWGNRWYRTDANLTNEVGGYFQSRFSGFPNTPPSVDQGGDVRSARFNYSSYALADAATVHQVMYSLGYTNEEFLLDPYAIAAGVDASDLIPLDTIYLTPETYFTEDSGNDSNPQEFWAAEDILWTPQARIAGITGGSIEIDWELQDGRTEAHSLALIQHLKSLCDDKGKKLTIWPNTLGNAGALYSGLDTGNLWDVHNSVDLLNMTAYNDGSTPIRTQLETMWAQVEAGGTVDSSKIMLTFSLGNPGGNNTTVQDAKDCHTWAKAKGISHIRFWRNFGVQGDASGTDEVNQKIGALALGKNVQKASTQYIML